MPETLTTDAPNAVIVDQGLLYFRSPSGEVYSADAADGEVMKKVRRGNTPLFEYGQFGSSAYYMDHPFEPLFQAGGAAAMSVDQVISLGYHLRPPLVPTCGQHVGQSKEHLLHLGNPNGRNARERGCWQGAQPVRFPQLEGVDIQDIPECEYCGRDDFATLVSLRQHQSVMHSDRRQQAELADGIVAGLMRSGTLPSGGSSSAAEIAAAVVIALRQLEQPPRPSARQRDAQGHFLAATPDTEDDEDND
jgi:hypothetical protein